MSTQLPPKSIAVVLGTRPEVVKLAHVIRLLGDAAYVVHSGQHYDDSLSKVFFEAFKLEDPDAALQVGGISRGQQIGEATSKLDSILADSRPMALVVQGDTNSALAGGLAANARDIPLVHIEAGLRSFDRRMPEEHNRVLVDHLADLCCAPTSTSVDNLVAEGIPVDRITETGNTVVEALEELLPPEPDRAAVLGDHGVASEGFVLATLHRPENVDDPDQLASVLDALRGLPLPVVYPMHPRTAGTVRRHGLSTAGIEVIEPIDYRAFLALAAESAAIVSDSGGIQEEASIIKRPVAVVRRSTERPEVLGTFATLVSVAELGEVVAPWAHDPAATHAHLQDIPSPYGDGTASARSVAALEELISA